MGVYYVRITFANGVMYPSIDVNRTIFPSFPLVVFEREGTAKAIKEPKALKEPKDPDKCKKGTKLRGSRGTKAGLKKPNTH